MLEERDPDGAEMGLFDPWSNTLEEPTYRHIKEDEPLYLEGGNPFDFSEGLTIDGLPVTRQEFERRVGNGSAGAEVSVGGRPVAFVTNMSGQTHITIDVFRVDRELEGLPQSQRWGGTYYIESFDIDLGVTAPASFAAANMPQKRQDLVGDKDLKPPRVTNDGTPLSQCAKKLLGWFFNEYLWRHQDPDRLLIVIRLRSGIHEIVKKYPTITPGSVTYCTEGYLKECINPKEMDNFDGLVLLAHEYTHSLQAAMFGDAAIVFGALYLADSGIAWARGKNPYEDNKWEQSASEVEAAFSKWLEKNYGKKDPCKRLSGGSW